MQLRQRLRQREPEPGAFVLAVEAAVDLAERHHRLVHCLGRDADAGVGDGDRQAATSLRPACTETAPPEDVNFTELDRRLSRILPHPRASPRSCGSDGVISE